MVSRFKRYVESFDDMSRDELERLVLASEVRAVDERVAFWQDAQVQSALAIRGLVILQHALIESLQDAKLSSRMWSAFSYGRHELKMQHMTYRELKSRFPERKLMRLGFQERGCWLALGFSLGCADTAALGRSVVEGIEENAFFYTDEYPILRFVVRLFANFTRVTLPKDFSTGRTHGILEELLGVWRAASARDLVPLVSGLCTLHIEQCRSNRRNRGDFGDGIGTIFQRFPIEILMLFRLRESLGLANPVIDHPLMQGPLGVLPEPRPCAPDDLLEAFLRKARAQGYSS